MNRNRIIFQLRALNIKFDESATTRQLNALLSSRAKVRNTARGQILVAFNAEKESEPVEVMVCDEIGKDPWTGEGFCLKDLRDSLSEVPRTRDLNFLVNSPGGVVNEGVAIRNWLNNWEGKITNTIIGVAASTASWCIPADETRAYKSSQMFVHKSWGFVMGNADDMRTAIQFLETTDGQIADIYADQTGKPRDEMLGLMSAETLLTGEQAKDLGLVDTIIDGEPASTFDSEQINSMKLKLAALNSTRSQISALPQQGERKNQPTNQPQDNKMNRAQRIALLNAWGVMVKDEASVTDARLEELVNLGKTAALAAFNGTPAPAKTEPTLINLQAEIEKQNQTIANLTTANTEAKRQRLTGEVDRLIAEDRIPEALKDKTLAILMNDESLLTSYYNSMPPKRPGSEPVGFPAIVGETGTVMKELNSKVVTGPKAFDNAVERGSAFGLIYTENRNKILPLFNTAGNTNTISSDLKRVAILQETIRAFAIRVLPLRLLSTTFSNVPLQGTDEIVVPYFPLRTDASTNFSQANGYVFAGTLNSSSKKITVNKRKYQPLDYSSNDFRRQPFFDTVRLGAMNAEKLAVDIFRDILSVVTIANFGAAVKTVPAASITSDDVVDIMGACNDANWPDMGRALIVDSSVNTSLQKDPDYKQALNIGTNSVITEGRFPKLSGFDFAWLPSLPENSENLIGFAAFASAILSAFCPVDPAPGVRAQLIAYDVVTDPATGISMNYRHWGDPDADEDREVIESAYGYVAGEAAAIKRIEKP